MPINRNKAVSLLRHRKIVKKIVSEQRESIVLRNQY